MEADQRDEIEEETYEDPSQTNQEEEPELYEDPQIQPVTTPTKQPAAASGYMDPIMLDNRKSMVPEDLIDDWECAYDSSNVKKKEKIKASKLNNVLMKGWLDKLGGRSHKNWQKRYCVLAELFMYFYEKESSSTYNNRIPIPGFVPNPSADLTQPKKNHFAFKLSSTDSSGKAKDYYFRARTEAERDQWVEAIRKIFEQGRIAIEKRKSQTLPVNFSAGGIPTGNSVRHLSTGFEQEEYEALSPAMIPEEGEEDQEEYVDVSCLLLMLV